MGLHPDMVNCLVSVVDDWHSVDDVTVVVKRMVMPRLRPLMQEPNPVTTASMGSSTLPIKPEWCGDGCHSGAAVTSTLQFPMLVIVNTQFFHTNVGGIRSLIRHI